MKSEIVITPIAILKGFNLVKTKRCLNKRECSLKVKCVNLLSNGLFADLNVINGKSYYQRE